MRGSILFLSVFYFIEIIKCTAMIIEHLGNDEEFVKVSNIVNLFDTSLLRNGCSSH